MEDIPGYTLKFLLLGDCGVGKTALAARFVKDTFDPTYSSTERLQFSSKEFVFKSLKLKAQIWDTAGKDRPEGMSRAYFKDAVGAVLVFDACDQASFDNIRKTWIPQVSAFGQARMPLVLVANKVAEGSSARVVSTEAGAALAREHDCSYMEVSALSDYNVDAMFRRIIFSVANILPGTQVTIARDSLPIGWLMQNTAAGTVYCNYWTGETVANKPKAAADINIAGKGDKDNIVKLEMTFRDSFCARLSPQNSSTFDCHRITGVAVVPISDEGVAVKKKAPHPSRTVCGESCAMS